MNFEEWFEQRFPANTPEGSAARTGQFKDYLEEAWAAGYKQSDDDYLNPDFDEDCPELAGGGSNYE